jgi:putative endonuclease
MDQIVKKLENSKACAFTYILKSLKDQGIYIGSTRNLTDRYYSKHLKGRVQSTKSRLPLMLIYFEEFDSYSEAYKREKYLKTGAGRDWLKENIL